jgi:hypothetical protein
MLNKTKLTFTLISYLAFNSPLVSYADYMDDMRACKKDSDCVQEPEVSTGCVHYCKEKDCQAKVCPPVSKDYKNFPACYVSNPCKSEPEGIQCIKNACVRIK